MNLSDVSKTAVLLLICRAVESERQNSHLPDPMAVHCLERLISLASEEDQRWLLKKKRSYEGLHARDARAGAARGKLIDRAAERFIAEHPACTVVNLACGFDTRFWRIKHDQCKYIELDLPEVIALKQELLQEHLSYEMIGRSVLDTAWIEQVTAQGKADFLLLAEGLFMWLPKPEATRLLQDMAAKFARSQLVVEMVPERYTHGLWKSLFRLHSRLDMGLDVAWEFGIQQPRDIEAYASGFKYIGDEKGSVGPVITVSINAG